MTRATKWLRSDSWQFLLSILVAAFSILGFWYLAEPDRPIAPVQVNTGELAPGLIAFYTDDGGRSVNAPSPLPNFQLSEDESIHPSLSPAFKAEWRGFMSIFESGTYRLTAGPGAAIYLDGKQVRAKLELNTGVYPIRVSYRRRPGIARLQLIWESDQFPQEGVPSSVLFHHSSDPVAREAAITERGRLLVQELGCVNCHTSASRLLHGHQGPRLNNIGDRIKLPWVYQWLRDPQSFRRGVVMPAMLDPQEAADVAAYLHSVPPENAGEKPIDGPDRLPGGESAQGERLYRSLGCAACHDQPDLSLAGIGSKYATAALANFIKNPYEIDPSGHMPSLSLSDHEALALANFLDDSRNSKFEQAAAKGDPKRGRELLESTGCLSCHQFNEDSLQNRRRAPRLESLDVAAGCLAEEPPRGIPRYDLSGEQRKAIEAFLGFYRELPDISTAPVFHFYERVQQLRCTACHKLDHFTPTVPPSDAVPPLTGVGAKLRRSWTEGVLTNHARARPWLGVRMPVYPSHAVQPIIEGLAKTAGVGPGDGAVAPLIEMKQQTRGVAMLGNDGTKGGLACVRCHDWGRYEGQGDERAPQLISAVERLRYDWFYSFMLNPGRFSSGTSMPDYFAEDDPKKSPEIINSLWAALSMGKDMPVPSGLDEADVVLGPDARPVPEAKPLVIRCYMPGATSAAIAVGFPGRVSYCFDAAECRLLYAWRGGFIDLTENLQSKTDQDKFTPTVKLLGEVFFRSPKFPLRVGNSDRVPTRRFRGYRLKQGIPEFHYQVDGIDVYERIQPAQGGKLVRHFLIGRVDRPLWFIEDKRLSVPSGTNVEFEVPIEDHP